MNVPQAVRSAQDRASGAPSTRLETSESAAPMVAASPLEKTKMSRIRTPNEGDVSGGEGMPSAKSAESALLGGRWDSRSDLGSLSRRKYARHARRARGRRARFAFVESKGVLARVGEQGQRDYRIESNELRGRRRIRSGPREPDSAGNYRDRGRRQETEGRSRRDHGISYSSSAELRCGAKNRIALVDRPSPRIRQTASRLANKDLVRHGNCFGFDNYIRVSQ